jgi:hypothetical protein
MSLSSPPPQFADRELPTSGRRLRALRGREEIARLTARLRSEHNEYESASQSWSPEAGEKKRELRKARADTLVEIGATLTWLGEVELFREIERLPFKQKLEQLDAFLEDRQGGSPAPAREGTAPPDVIPHAIAEPSIASPELVAPPDAIPHAVVEPSIMGLEPGVTPDAIPHAVAEPFIVGLEPGATLEAPRAASESTRLASLPPRSMRPRSRRPMGHWPVRLAPSAMPRPPTWRVPLLVGVIAVQGLALAVLALALLRVTPRYSESDPSRAAPTNATATAMATPLPPPATQPAGSGIPSGPPVAAPTGEPRPAADAQTPIRAATPPHSPPRSKPTAVPTPPALARRPEIFIPDTL